MSRKKNIYILLYKGLRLHQTNKSRYLEWGLIMGKKIQDNQFKRLFACFSCFLVVEYYVSL